MRRLVEMLYGRWAALGVLVAAAIYDRWRWERRLAAVAGHRQLVVNAGAIALGGGTVTVVGSAAGTHGRQ
jgi:hypothetical protein